MVERREDIGGKVIVGVLIALVGFACISFIGASWSTANAGNIKADNLDRRMTILEVEFRSIGSDVKEIKDLLKRGLPKGASNE